ncbi:MAG: Fic family protein [Deltaproteobacteria bacterium]|nr:Fic family protein [Deltaproteobacteria bacterium]
MISPASSPPPWNADRPSDRALIESNLRSLLTGIVRDRHERKRPTSALARDWHRAAYDQIVVPVPCYVGNFRGDAAVCPELASYEVTVGQHCGTPSSAVAAEVARFEASARAAIGTLDAVPPGTFPTDPSELWSIVTLCAYVHGEWVRIHPFANGNGRIARIWANWCALRYELPPYVRLKPRPGKTAYGRAAEASMQGDHDPMAHVFHNMLQQHLRQSR